MSNSIVLRQSPKITMTANDAGLLFATDNGWTVAMLAPNALEYVGNLGKKNDPDRGFFRFPAGSGDAHDGKYVLSHSGAKIFLSQDETNKVVEFIRQSSAGWKRA